MSSPHPGIDYSSKFVSTLFDEMSSTYGLMNSITSLGFSERWRCQAVKAIQNADPGHVCDLMCGMGESWKYLSHHLPGLQQLHAIDFSTAMCAGARSKAEALRSVPVNVLQQDVLQEDLPRLQPDALVCSFGLKTLDEAGMRQLVANLPRLLKPGGHFAFVEISVPPSPWLRLPYLFYLQWIIPLFGRLFLGNPDNYRWLARYTLAFGNGRRFTRMLQEAGHACECRDLFFGCASLISGQSAELKDEPEPVD